jgi:hypothetical protein
LNHIDTTVTSSHLSFDAFRLELGSFKERFEKGTGGDETSSPTEKTTVDVHCAELDNIKAAFEKVSFLLFILQFLIDSSRNIAFICRVPVTRVK